MRTATSVCPICGRPSDAPPADGRRSVAPFCSTRCADVDLGRWFTGQYRIPVESDDADEDGGIGEEAGPVG